MPKDRVTKPRAKTKSAGTLALTGDHGLPQAEALKSKLKARLARATPLTLDLSGVTQLDAASLQLLIAFVRERGSRGRVVAWRGVPRSTEDAVQRLGLTAALGVHPA